MSRPYDQEQETSASALARSENHCAPLCGASKAYGRYDQPWKHEAQCPVRIVWEAEKERNP